MNRGRISKSIENVILTGNYIKKNLGLQLNAREEEIELKYFNDKL